MLTHPHDPKSDPPTLGRDAPLQPEEVSLLWSFIHGDIMIGGIREHLRRALGLCPRHTWGYFVTEVELWLYGPAPRGGHIPFDVGILYQDLLADAITKISSAHATSRRGLRAPLTPKASCRICADLAIPSQTMPLGYAGSNAEELAAEAGELTYTTAWLLRTEDAWRERVCPQCAAPQVQDHLTTPALLCRPHLALLESVTPEDAQAIASRLDEMRRRLYRSVASMTQGAEPATVDEDAAVVETLGWFAGWQFPLALTTPV